MEDNRMEASDKGCQRDAPEKSQSSERSLGEAGPILVSDLIKSLSNGLCRCNSAFM